MFTFDEGLADKQAHFIYVVRPLVSAFQELEQTGEADVDGDEPLVPDPDHIKALIKDAIVLLGNAHCRLNSWRHKRFAEFLTDVGKRTLKKQIPADKHLFPEQFHNVIREENDHANNNRKVVAQPTKPQTYFSPRGRFQAYSPFVRSPFVTNPSSDQNFPEHNEMTPTRKTIPVINPFGHSVEAMPNVADYQPPTLKDIRTTDNFVACKIRHFYANWTLITTDPWILSIVLG